MKSKTIWNFALNNLNKNKKVVLLIVASSSNSSPGRRGFKMAVAENAEMFGTIGGGIMEKDIVEFALGLLFSGKRSAIKRLQHSGKTKLESSGLICGGRQTVLLNVFDESDKPAIEKIISNTINRKPGKLKLTQSDFSYCDSDMFSSVAFNDAGEEWEYIEQIGIGNTAYIIGGGHIGLAVSGIMKSIGFYVIVFDHREDVFTLEQNDFADEKIICPYDKIGEKIIEGDMSYVMIATPMHAGDGDALFSVIRKDLKYIGLMGSAKKLKTIFDVMRKKGIPDRLISKVHSPIGLEIEAETPEEIAVSIAAEIIKVKNT